MLEYPNCCNLIELIKRINSSDILSRERVYDTCALLSFMLASLRLTFVAMGNSRFGPFY